MRSIRLISVFATLLFASFAFGQTQPRVQQPPPAAKVGPYKAVSVTPPQAISDATFETFRKQMNEAAQRKDRGALTKLVVAQDFFRLREMVIVPTRKNPASTISQRPEQQGWRWLGHACKFYRRSDRLTFA
jgi:hypothetical protein